MSVDAFVVAAGNGNVGAVTRYINNQIAIDGFHSTWHGTALMRASGNGHDAAVRLLLSGGASVNLADEDGWTALMFACNNGFVAVAELLMRGGADPSLKNKGGKTAVEWCRNNTERAQVQAIISSLPKSAAVTPSPPIPITSIPTPTPPAQPMPTPSTPSVTPIPKPIPTPVSAPISAPVPVAAPPAPAPVPGSAAAAAAAAAATTTTIDQLRAQLASMTSERDSLQMELAIAQSMSKASDQEELIAHLAAESMRLNVELTQRTTELRTVTSQRDVALSQLKTRTAAMDQLNAEKAQLAAELVQRTKERDAAIAERDDARQTQGAVAPEIGGGRAAVAPLDMCPFVRYQPHCFGPGIIPAGSGPGLYDVPTTSALFCYLRQLCDTGGSWMSSIQRPVAGFRLARVQAVVPRPFLVSGYTSAQDRINALRASGGTHFNHDCQQHFTLPQLHVLNVLRDAFHERPPGCGTRTINTLYCYHGPRREHLESICSNGMVAVGGMDAGFFGSGCYTTLNMEYAVKYAYGDFDTPQRPRTTLPEERGLYPIIMFAATVGMAYPITREVDYLPGAMRSQFFGRPLMRGFDAHVVCVNQPLCQAVASREQCEYVELVIEQQAQLLPLAVLWFDKL